MSATLKGVIGARRRLAAEHAADAAARLKGSGEERDLSRWGLGVLVHGLWALAMLAALASLLLLLATRRYGFVWETTILGGDTFIALTQAIGALPALLGFSLPDIEVIRASGDAAIASEVARQSWAGWLVGVLLVYGLLPRLLLALLCLWRWQSGKGALRLDLELPGYGLLRQRLQPDSERLGICDLAPAALHQPQGWSYTIDCSRGGCAGDALVPFGSSRACGDPRPAWLRRDDLRHPGAHRPRLQHGGGLRPRLRRGRPPLSPHPRPAHGLFRRARG